MLQLAFIREHREEVLQRLAKRRIKDAESKVDEILSLDSGRRHAQKQADDARAEGNALARQIGELMRAGKKEEAEAMRVRTGELKLREKELSEALGQMEAKLQEVLVTLPNTPHASVREGADAADNEEVFRHGEKPQLDGGALPHWELAQKHGIIDFELGVKLTGAGFPVYRGKGARLQRALINFFLDRATTAGYDEVQPPIVVNEQSGFSTGQLPDKEGQMYYVSEDDLYLIPTAEVPVTNIYRDVILREDELPRRHCAYTPCFRREAGSYGKDVRGLNRLHQFDKVEIVQITHPEKSYSVLEDMRQYVAGLLTELELPFRTLRLCGGDMGFTSALTYDMEVWSAAQDRWLEVSSISNFETFQTNRLKCRYRDEKGKTQLAHSLNGSALALPRIVAALLENNQQDGRIRIPPVLVPYCGFEYIG